MDSREKEVREVISIALYGSWGNDHERDHHAPSDVYKALVEAGWLRLTPAPRFTVEVVPLDRPMGGAYRVLDGGVEVGVMHSSRDAELFVKYLKHYGGSNEGR